MTVFVFTGPSLPPNDARRELDAIYLPPVSEGDVYRAALKKPRAIGIIDGFFENIPSVWHKEVLWAMSRGVHVFGSASMGALRAAELAPFGMEGVGAIFEAYRDGMIEDDDEVAVIHGPMEVGYPVLSEAMVNIRRTLEDARAEGIVCGATHDALISIAKGLFYHARSYPNVIQRARLRGLPSTEISSLLEWLPQGKVNQKREDAVAMLRVMRRRLSEGLPPKEVRFSFEHTTIWEAASRRAMEQASGLTM